MFCLGIFRQQMEKTTAIFETITLKVVQDDLITNTGNFGIELSFSKGSGFFFSQGPCPGVTVNIYSLKK